MNDEHTKNFSMRFLQSAEEDYLKLSGWTEVPTDVGCILWQDPLTPLQPMNAKTALDIQKARDGFYERF